jgi:hypothetical protein
MCPVEGLEYLHELSHGRRCSLVFFSRSSPELLLEVVVDDDETACSASGWNNGRDGLVAGWPKLAGGENKSDNIVELESRRDLAMATPRDGFPLYTSTETQRSSQPTTVGTSGAIRRWPHGAR